MRQIFLVMTLSVLWCACPPGFAGEEDAAKAYETCDPESGENCELEAGEGEREELDRGFDPCLVNASLPACQPDAATADPGAAEKAPSNAEETGDSG